MKRTKKKPSFEVEENFDISENIIAEALIKSTEFIKIMKPVWDNNFMQTSIGKSVSRICLDYYAKYGKAPQKNFEKVLFKKIDDQTIDEDTASTIEAYILQPLKENYEETTIDLPFVVDSTEEYFRKRQATLLKEDVEILLSKGKTKEALDRITKLKLIDLKTDDGSSVLDLSDKEKVKQIAIEAFNNSNVQVLNYKGAIGEFWNDAMVRGALVGILARDKIGKTFLLLDMMMQAVKQGVPVAFIQAGDMTEKQQLMRIAIYLAQKSNKEEYVKQLFIPVKDCIKNQAHRCSLDLRECFVDLETGKEPEAIRQEPLPREQIIELIKEHPDYKPCFNCSAFNKNKWGTTWLKKKKRTSPLGVKETIEKTDKFFSNKNARLATFVNGTLTLTKIKILFEDWKLEGFEPGLVLLDYGDLLVPEIKMEFRHQQDYIWRGLRGFSQKTDALWVVPTQADTDSYTATTLTSKNFSEDKRKNAHVSAMFGLNQDPNGIEKERGVLRINELVFRDGDFSPKKQVTVLQCLAIGRPILDSFF